MNKGLFVVFEGADSVGKSSLMEAVHQRYSLFDSSFYFPGVLITQEPTGSRIGLKIRELLKQNVPSKDLLDLFLEDRKQHVEFEILPTLSAGSLVICDRYKYSTICYQALEGYSFEKLIELNQSFPVPDVTFILDLGTDVNVVLERLKGKTDCFDKLLLYQEVRLNYLELPKLLPHEKFIFLDASLPINELVELVFEKIKEVLELKKEMKVGK